MKVSFWKHFPILDQKAEALAKATIDFQAEFECDFVKITPAGTWQAVCHGAEDQSLENDNLGRRSVVKAKIESSEDWLNLIDFSADQPQLLKEMLEACRLVVESSEIYKAVFPTMFCPISQAIQMTGLELFLKHCEEHPEKVKQGIAQITENTKWLIEAFKKNGAKGLYYVTQHMQDTLVPPAVYRDFGMDSDTQCLLLCKEFEYSIFHLHGDHVVPSLSDIPENCIIHYTDKSAEEALRGVSSTYGIPTAVMRNLIKEEEIDAFLANFKSDYPNLKVVTAECVIPLDFPEEQLKRWIEAIKRA